MGTRPVFKFFCSPNDFISQKVYFSNLGWLNNVSGLILSVPSNQRLSIFYNDVCKAACR